MPYHWGTKAYIKKVRKACSHSLDIFVDYQMFYFTLIYKHLQLCGSQYFKRNKEEVKKIYISWLLPELLLGRIFSFAISFCPRVPFSLPCKNMDILTETQCIKWHYQSQTENRLAYLLKFVLKSSIQIMKAWGKHGCIVGTCYWWAQHHWFKIHCSHVDLTVP